MLFNVNVGTTPFPVFTACWICSALTTDSNLLIVSVADKLVKLPSANETFAVTS